MVICSIDFFFFFKQKTAYEMRISDWSSDVCSSDLSNAGKHEGYRRAHAKGVCFTGYFDASGGAGALSRTPLLRSGRHAAIGRFSTGGGQHFATDGRNVFRAMALQLTGPDGEIWRLAMEHTPNIPHATPQATRRTDCRERGVQSG